MTNRFPDAAPRWRRLFRALAEAHGRERAVRIALGKDPETNRDLERWKRLGEPKPKREAS